ncbi:MAG: hypothetical protein JWP57_4327 [Spirosoma sp.]|nr:hypothetical protein [Spirosoma sp.]
MDLYSVPICAGRNLIRNKVYSFVNISGLASFMAEARTKEIGVRNVLGASVLNLWAYSPKTL